MPIETIHQGNEAEEIFTSISSQKNDITKRSNSIPSCQEKEKNKNNARKLHKIKNTPQNVSPCNSKTIIKNALYFMLLVSKIKIDLQTETEQAHNSTESVKYLINSRRHITDDCAPEQDISALLPPVDSNTEHDAHPLAYKGHREFSSWFSFLPMMAAASHLNHTPFHPPFNLSDIFSDNEIHPLFYHYNILSQKNSMLFHLTTQKKQAIFEKGRNAIMNYYNKFNEHNPSLRERARQLLKEKIKERFNIDLNPDQTYFMHFKSGISTPDTVTGWYHLSPPFEWGPLTRYLFTNFPADAQENIDTTNMWCGIYSIYPNMTTEFGKEYEVRIRPQDFINLVWDIDFYKKAKTYYLPGNMDKEAYTKKNFMDFILNLAVHKPDHETTDDILSSVGLIEGNNNVIVTQFDINGYQASNLFVFTNTKTLRVTLYMPNHESKFLSFSHLRDMRIWFINNCVDQTHRDVIASHFSLYNRQDGIIYDGIDKWLNTLSREVIAEEHIDKICTRFTPLASHRFFETMTNLEQDRRLKDLDILIKSDAEVTRDIWERDIDTSNIIPNPVSPFISLGLHLEHALDGDTEQERFREWNNVVNDLLSMVLMILMDKVINVDADGYDFIDTVKNDISSGIAGREFDALFPVEEITLSEIERRQTIITVNSDQPLFISNTLLNDITQLPTLDETLFSQLTPNNEGIFLYQTPHDTSEKMAIRINDKFYALRSTGHDGIYHLDNGNEMALFDGVYYIRTPSTEGNIIYIPCQAKRSPGGACIHFSDGMNALLMRCLTEAMTDIEIGTTQPHEKYNAIAVNPSGKMFLPYRDVFFQIKESSSGFKILAKKRTRFFQKLSSRKTLGKFHFSRTNGMYYLNTPIENTMEVLGCSQAAAELYDFNIKNLISSDLITREEMYAIKSYGNMGFDPINAYMQEGMPKSNTIPLNSENMLSDAVKNIRSLLSKLPSYPGTVYRGGMLTQAELASLKPGDIVMSKKFISASTDKNIAKSYAQSRGADGIFYTISLVKRGHPIGMYTMRIHEAEILIEDGTLFTCTSVQGKHVELEELPRHDDGATIIPKVLSM